MHWYAISLARNVEQGTTKRVRFGEGVDGEWIPALVGGGLVRQIGCGS
jgi:hypothetical protein